MIFKAISSLFDLNRFKSSFVKKFMSRKNCLLITKNDVATQEENAGTSLFFDSSIRFIQEIEFTAFWNRFEKLKVIFSMRNFYVATLNSEEFFKNSH